MLRQTWSLGLHSQPPAAPSPLALAPASRSLRQDTMLNVRRPLLDCCRQAGEITLSVLNCIWQLDSYSVSEV